MSARRETADAAWRWVLAQVRYDDLGPWIPEVVSAAGEPAANAYRDGMHSGIGGLAHALAELRTTRTWAAPEAALAEAIGVRLRTRTDGLSDVDSFDGLVSDIGVLATLGEPGIEACVDRLLALAKDDRWPTYSDATMGTGAIVIGGLVAAAHDVERGLELAERAAEALLAEAEPADGGLNWLFVPRRKMPAGEQIVQMPNWSHGLAGIAAVLADAGVALGRPDLVDAARRGAEHLITLADTSKGGFVVPRRIPWKEGWDDVTWNWCHGPVGTSALFTALERAGTDVVAGESPRSWHARCLRATRRSGIPERVYPGFWDNDGRCCGTAGVGDGFLDAWERYGDPEDLAFATVLGDALLERAILDGDHAYWRFVEHRNDDPLLPPGVGWMQGAAGIAAYLWRLDRPTPR